MRFYLDENLSPLTAEIARQRGVDVVSAAEVGRFGLSDDEQLQYAAAEARCIVTRDYADFDRLTQQYQAAGHAHTGVLFVPGSLPTANFAGIADAIARYDRAHPNGVLPYQVDFLTAG
jgi:hypothetical protein